MENSASRKKNWLVCSLRKPVPVSMLVSMATVMFAGMTLIWPLAFGHEGSVVAGRTPNLSPQMEKLPMEESEGPFSDVYLPTSFQKLLGQYAWAWQGRTDKLSQVHAILKQEYSSVHLLGIFMCASPLSVNQFHLVLTIKFILWQTKLKLTIPLMVGLTNTDVKTQSKVALNTAWISWFCHIYTYRRNIQ